MEIVEMIRLRAESEVEITTQFCPAAVGAAEPSSALPRDQRRLIITVRLLQPVCGRSSITGYLPHRHTTRSGYCNPERQSTTRRG